MCTFAYMDISFLGLGYHAWITLFVIVVSFTTLIRTKLPVYFVFMVGLATLTLTECIELKTATEGFSSSTMVMLVGLYFVISALETTGFMKEVAVKMLGKPRSYNNAIVRVMLVVGALSGFLSNTAVVALFVKDKEELRLVGIVRFDGIVVGNVDKNEFMCQEVTGSRTLYA